jgi:hypothetical protein
VRFEHCDAARNKRIRDFELTRGTAKTPRFGNADEDSHGLDLIHGFNKIVWLFDWQDRVIGVVDAVFLQLLRFSSMVKQCKKITLTLS